MDELDEKVLDISQRQKRAQIMRRYKSKIERAREMAKKRMAPESNIRKRAFVQARQIIRRRVAGARGAEYEKLGPSEKIAIDRAVEGKQKAIKKLALRLIPRVKQAEAKRLHSFMKGQQIQNQGQPEGKSKESSGSSSVKESINNLFQEAFPPTDTSSALGQKVDNPVGTSNGKKMPPKGKSKSSEIVIHNKFQEEVENDTAAFTSLFKKSEKSGIDIETLGEVYNRGWNTWTEGVKVSQQQYAFARVNSYINQGKTYFNEDRDLHELSKDTMKRYKDDASWDRDYERGAEDDKTWQKRDKGIQLAKKKLREGRAPGTPSIKRYTRNDGTTALKSLNKWGKRKDWRDTEGGLAKAREHAGVDKVTEEVQQTNENFMDGKGPGKPGDSARHGLKGKSASELRKIRSSETASPRKKQLAHWLLNMHHNESVDEGLKDPEDNPCWKGYKPVGTKKKAGKVVPNCVPEETQIDETGKVSRKVAIQDLQRRLAIAKSNPKSTPKQLAQYQKKIHDMQALKGKWLEEEQLDELSTKTLKSYISKASDVAKSNYQWKGGFIVNKVSSHKAKNRKQGVLNATDRIMQREEVNESYDVNSKHYKALTDLDLNTKNRDMTTKHDGYGPLNPLDKKGSKAFWEDKAKMWNTTTEAAMEARCRNCAAFNQAPAIMKKMAEGLGPAGEKIQDLANLGFCELFEFKCAGDRTCNKWLVNGPITEEDTGNGTKLVDKESNNSKIRKKIETVDRKPPHTEYTRQAEIKNKIIEDKACPICNGTGCKCKGNTQNDPKKREIGTDSLVKAYKADTPFSENLDESFNIAFAAGIGVTLTAADLGMKAQGGFAYHPSVIEEMDEVEEEVRSADYKGVIVKTADGRTVVRKQKVDRKIIKSGNVHDGESQ